MPSQPVELTVNAPKYYLQITKVANNFDGGKIKYVDWDGVEHTETTTAKKYPVLAGSTFSVGLKGTQKRNKAHFANYDKLDGITTDKYEAKYSQIVTVSSTSKQFFTFVMPTHDVICKFINADAGSGDIGDTLDIYWLQGYGWDMSKVGMTD